MDERINMALQYLLSHGADANEPELVKEERENAVEMLKMYPEAMDVFEREYRKASEAEEKENDKNNWDLFFLNSRQAIGRLFQNKRKAAQKVADLTKRIVDELLLQTYPNALTDANMTSSVIEKPVTLDEVNSLPPKLRPQLTGTLMRVDFTNPSYVPILDMLARYKKTGDMQFYHLFRSGLDRLDLDPVTYEILGMNRNSIGNWFPALKIAVDMQDFFRVPETKIVKVPMPILQLTRTEFENLSETTLDIVNQWAFKAFGLDEDRTYFVKTGTYSSKFDFRNAKVTTPKEVRELGSYLLFIHYQALSMAWAPMFAAAPKPIPTIYGVSTTNEWCVREYIEDKENNPCIYHGMPLHTEYRVFIDCDKKEVLGVVPYWHPEVMKERFSKGMDADTADMKHDYVIYCAHEETLMGRYEKNKDAVVRHVWEMLPDIELNGQWSLDVMQNGDEFWIIDMAVASSSALREYIEEGLIINEEDGWLNRLPVPSTAAMLTVSGEAGHASQQ